jgi:hypothetical protein
MVVYWSVPDIFYAEHMKLSTHEPTRTVVSITSFSHRVFHLRECLDSVFMQSQLPDRVIVSIPKKFRAAQATACPLYQDCTDQHYNESVEGMVSWFSEYTDVPYVYSLNVHTHNNSYLYEFGILTVQFLDDDWGPSTKLIGALLLETHPETVIITFDDDMVYNKDTVRWLATHIQADTALSFGCEMWTSTCKCAFIDVSTYSVRDFYMTTPRVCDGWLVGWTAVAYHVSSFGPDIWTFQKTLPPAASAGCFYNDDILLSGYLRMQGVRKVYAPSVLKHVKHTKDWTLSLSIINMGDREKYSYTCARHLFP